MTLACINETELHSSVGEVSTICDTRAALELSVDSQDPKFSELRRSEMIALFVEPRFPASAIGHGSSDAICRTMEN